MCDFHSVVCYVDGAIYHAASNSHTAAVKLSGRPENDGIPRFVEAEWDGHGKYPGAEKITRGEPNERQIRAIDAHYRELSRVMKTGDFNGIWAEAEYADVRREFIRRCPAERLPEYADRLLGDAEWDVRAEFVRRCPAERLPEYADTLLADREGSVRLEFAARCPTDRLVEFADRLLSDSDWRVRHAFAAYGPLDRLLVFADRLLDDADRDVRHAFVRRCPPDRLVEFADRVRTDVDRDVRREFARRCPTV